MTQSTRPPGASPLTKRLSAKLSEFPPPEVLADERDATAQARLGATLNQWQLVRLLGCGPITDAYEAARGGERGTLKILATEFARHERARSLFLRSSYAANRFQHARVLPILMDGADADNRPFIVRPWTDGVPLADVLLGGAMSEAQVLRLSEQVLDALELAHAHGIVHGAITPNNILVTPRASVRLCDFATPPGAAVQSDREGDALAPRRIGAFTAPERCSIHAPLAQETSDIYAVAACMYFAVARLPPRGDEFTTPEELAAAPLIPIRDVVPAVSEGFSTILAHALGTNAERRYESAYAMLGDVRRVMAGRRPKLSDALAPVPSGSYRELPSPGPQSSLRTGAGLRSEPPASQLSMTAQRLKRDEWKGNVALIFAIAFLVGLATFVLVREKVEESRAREMPRRGAVAPVSPP